VIVNFKLSFEIVLFEIMTGRHNGCQEVIS